MQKFPYSQNYEPLDHNMIFPFNGIYWSKLWLTQTGVKEVTEKIV